MSERTAYENGRPCWIDATSTDLGATQAFYEGLFGWQLTDLGEETGHYTMCDLHGKRVAALIARTAGDPSPPHWTTYLATDDLEATLQEVRAAGGSVAVEPMDVFESGRLAYAADPTGAPFGLWQAKDFAGAGLVNEAGAWGWSELRTHDVPRALAFYAQVFGHDARAADQRIPYDELYLRGTEEVVGGAMKLADGNFPPEVPPHWGVYFFVADLDAATARVQELGGERLIDPIQGAFGRFAPYKDPVGATFSLYAPTGES
jgi:uncharacterized protein